MSKDPAEVVKNISEMVQNDPEVRDFVDKWNPPKRVVLVVERTQTYVVSVPAENLDAIETDLAMAEDIRRQLQGNDPVNDEIEWHKPDRFEQKAYAEVIEYEQNDDNF